MKTNTNKNDELFTTFAACSYLTINDGSSDGLKKSRNTGELWGYPAPRFIKAKRKILYRKSDLDNFLAQIPTFGNNAEVRENLRA
jgi:hypothetical protein